VTKKGQVMKGEVSEAMGTEGVIGKRGIRRRGPVTKPSPKDRTLKKFRLIFFRSNGTAAFQNTVERKIVNEEAGVRGAEDRWKDY
jgi:hypothetical protein